MIWRGFVGILWSEEPVNHVTLSQNCITHPLKSPLSLYREKTFTNQSSNKMGKDQNGRRHLHAGTMLTQKTNEDFNKKKPDPSDPNEQKSDPDTAVPDIGDDEIDPVKSETADEEDGTYKNEGSE